MTLNKLENEIRLYSLEKAKDPEPWELITEPTLLIDPVAPKKKSIITLSTLLGLILSCSISITKKTIKSRYF